MAGLWSLTVPYDGGFPPRWPVIPGQVYNYDIMVYCPASNTSSKSLWLWGGFTTVASKNGVNVDLGATKSRRLKVRGITGPGERHKFAISSAGSLPLAMNLNFGFANNAVGAAGETVYIDRVLLYRAWAMAISSAPGAIEAGTRGPGSCVTDHVRREHPAAVGVGGVDGDVGCPQCAHRGSARSVRPGGA